MCSSPPTAHRLSLKITYKHFVVAVRCFSNLWVHLSLLWATLLTLTPYYTYTLSRGSGRNDRYRCLLGSWCCSWWAGDRIKEES